MADEPKLEDICKIYNDICVSGNRGGIPFLSDKVDSWIKNRFGVDKIFSETRPGFDILKYTEVKVNKDTLVKVQLLFENGVIIFRTTIYYQNRSTTFLRAAGELNDSMLNTRLKRSYKRYADKYEEEIMDLRLKKLTGYYEESFVLRLAKTKTKEFKAIQDVSKSLGII